MMQTLLPFLCATENTNASLGVVVKSPAECFQILEVRNVDCVSFSVY
jgi:hypothetical protein